MQVNVRRLITGSALKAGVLHTMGAAPCTYMPLIGEWATTLVKTSVKMLLSICMVLGVFCRTGFNPKPFTAKDFKKCDNYIPISTPCKKPHLLKPFKYAHLAASQVGMRHPKAVSHFVSFFASNIMGIWASALSHSGNMRQVFWVSQSVSFLRRFDNFKKVVKSVYHGLSTMHYLPRLCYFCVLCKGPPSFLFAILFTCIPYLYGQLFVCHKPKKDETIKSTTSI